MATKEMPSGYLTLADVSVQVRTEACRDACACVSESGWGVNRGEAGKGILGLRRGGGGGGGLQQEGSGQAGK